MTDDLVFRSSKISEPPHEHKEEVLRNLRPLDYVVGSPDSEELLVIAGIALACIDNFMEGA